MTKKHADTQNALFRSSEFLADVLTRCAFIETNHYRNDQFGTKDKIEKAIIKVYTGILRYSARVQKRQKANAGEKMLESVSTVSDHPIIQIEYSVKDDEQILHHWVQRNEHLELSEQAKKILAHVDKALNSIHALHCKFDLKKLQCAEGAIVLLASPLSVNSLASLISLPEDDIYDYLDKLHAVLHVPSDPEAPVRMLHLSFRDFLLTSKTRFSVDDREVHRNLTMQCSRVMCDGLRKNICKLELEDTQRTEIDQHSINECISLELQYSCRYWVHHLAQSRDPVTGIESVFSFLQGHFLHWMEAISILGLASELVEVIDKMQRLIQNNEHSQLFAFLQDARRFALTTRHLADTTPLQLYSSGLIFAPVKSLIRERFKRDIPYWINKPPKVWESWSAELDILEGHSGWISLVAFSPDGQLLASASNDKTVNLWDPSSGVLQQTLEGHSDLVSTVAFSPDGQLLASASYDKTVKLWDPNSGVLQQTLEVKRIASELSFAEEGLYLGTALGTFVISQSYGKANPSHSPIKLEICVLNDWVALQGREILWLPSAYRPICVANRNGFLVMGHASGRVTFFEFCQ